MMKLHINLICLITISFLLACSGVTNTKEAEFYTQDEKKSRVTKFEYGGYGDTNKALLYGYIYLLDTNNNSNNKLLPIANAAVKIQESDTTVFTDSEGNFALAFDKGVYNLLILKQGYQPIRITNYVSNPDQVSHAEIVLEKGKLLQIFEVPEWTK